MQIFRVSKTSSRRRQNRGFATVEVLVTLAVVLLVGTLSIVAMGSTDRARLHDEVTTVALLLQQARLQAAESGQPVIIDFSQDARVLTAGNQRHDLGRGISSPTPSTRVLIRPSGENEGLYLTLVAGDRKRTVEMDWLTGQVRFAQ